jgi:cytochrome d ubiquinol oxidase subunit I
MVAIGLFFVALMGITLLQWLRGKLTESAIAEQKWLWLAWIGAAPLGYIAVEAGWIVRCVGRQPWIVYGELRTADSASHLPPGEILFSLLGLMALYSVLFVSTLYFGSRIIRKGPNRELLPPQTSGQSPLKIDPSIHSEDSRPTEA